MSYKPTQGIGVGVITQAMAVAGDPLILCATSMWTHGDNARKAEITTGFTGAAAYAEVVPDGTVAITAPADDTLDPEIAGIQRGAIIPYLYLYTTAPTWNPTTGAVVTHGHATLIRNVFVDSVETTGDSTADVQRKRFTLSGGKPYLNQVPVTPARDPDTILP